LSRFRYNLVLLATGTRTDRVSDGEAEGQLGDVPAVY